MLDLETSESVFWVIIYMRSRTVIYPIHGELMYRMIQDNGILSINGLLIIWQSTDAQDCHTTINELVIYSIRADMTK